MLDPNDDIIEQQPDEDEEEHILDDFGEPHKTDEDEPFGRFQH